MSEPILEIRDLNKSYRNRKVIDELDMTVNLGDIYGFLGSNGQGKTTTIRMVDDARSSNVAWDSDCSSLKAMS